MSEPTVLTRSVCPSCQQMSLTGELVRTRSGVHRTKCQNPACGVTVYLNRKTYEALLALKVVFHA